MNRKVVGPNWWRRPEDRIWAFFFPEKLYTNPHWHGLIEFFPPYPDQLKEQMRRFDLWAENRWRAIAPGGTVNIQNIEDQDRVADYVSKQLGDVVSYENFVIPDEFWT
jgi:hypothetical protein